MERWRGDATAPQVSICCATFNHRSFIEQAIDSFLMQETDFPFEILIHDDASNDGTEEVVELYRKRYPAIIRTIVQDENQYSKLPIIVPRFLFPIVKGEFVAFCEGDDYWCSPQKLATQYAELKSNPNVDLCFHPVYEQAGSRKKGIARVSKSTSAILIDRKRIVLGGGGYCSTASLLIRASTISAISSCVERAPVADKFIQIVASMNNGALHIPQTMAVYRVGHPGAWTSRIDSTEMLDQYERLVKFPYQWLYENCDDELSVILKFSEADQYATVGRKYSAIGDSDNAKRLLSKTAGILREIRFFGGFVDWSAQGTLRTKIFLTMYPGFRTIFRHKSLYGAQ